MNLPATRTDSAMPTPEDIRQRIDDLASQIEDEGVSRALRVQAKHMVTLFEWQSNGTSFMPRNAGEVGMLADALIRAQCVPAGLDSREQVVVAIMKSCELGIEPITGISNIMVVNNRPSVWGDLAIALVQRSGKVADQLKEPLSDFDPNGIELSLWPDDYGYRYSIWRKGQERPYVGEYTVGKAKRANLWLHQKKKPWLTNPDDMLFNRARGRALNAGFADCLYGLGIVEIEQEFDNAGPVEEERTADMSSLEDEPETDDTPAIEDHTEQQEQALPANDGEGESLFEKMNAKVRGEGEEAA
tara:strand:+ start:1083 stop:1985 length:903 start_codon:yes stop_codon:yes gene_type:complete